MPASGAPALLVQAMFPDITCDDIFRLETARLWLRWLRASDAPALAAIASSANATEASTFDAIRSVGGAERFILHARATTASGTALILAVTGKNKGRSLAGVVSAHVAERGEVEIGYLIASQQTGRGLASEAVASLAEATFALTATRALIASIRPDNKASRRVLEKCGFTEVARGSDSLASHHLYRRDRSTWLPGGDRHLPSIVGQSRPATGSERDD